MSTGATRARAGAAMEGERVSHRTLRATIAACAGLCLLAGAAGGQEFPPGPVAANRVVILYENNTFEVLERLELRTVLAPFDPLPESDNGISGFWYELQDAEGAVRYRRFIGDPIRLVFEGPDLVDGQPPDQNPTPDGELLFPDRKEDIPARRVFSLLIPAARTGDQLVLFSSPLVPGEQALRASEIARLDLVVVEPISTLR